MLKLYDDDNLNPYVIAEGCEIDKLLGYVENSTAVVFKMHKVLIMLAYVYKTFKMFNDLLKFSVEECETHTALSLSAFKHILQTRFNIGHILAVGIDEWEIFINEIKVLIDVYTIDTRKAILKVGLSKEMSTVEEKLGELGAKMADLAKYGKQDNE